MIAYEYCVTVIFDCMCWSKDLWTVQTGKLFDKCSAFMLIDTKTMRDSTDNYMVERAVARFSWMTPLP